MGAEARAAENVWRASRLVAALVAGSMLGAVGLGAVTSGGCEGCFMDQRVRKTTIEVVNGKVGATVVEVCDEYGRCEIHTWSGPGIVVGEVAYGGAFSDCVYPYHTVKVSAPGCTPVETWIPAAVSTTRAPVTLQVSAALACSP